MSVDAVAHVRYVRRDLVAVAAVSVITLAGHGRLSSAQRAMPYGCACPFIGDALGVALALLVGVRRRCGTRVSATADSGGAAETPAVERTVHAGGNLHPASAD